MNRRVARGLLAVVCALGAPRLHAQATDAPAGAPADAPKKAADSWTFNPLNVKRDPFFPPSSERKGGGPQNELRQVDLNEIHLVAIMTGLGAPQAMVVLPNGKTHIIQERDFIGRHNGRVHRISQNEVVVQEAFKDFKGRDKRSFTSLVMAP